MTEKSEVSAAFFSPSSYVFPHGEQWLPLTLNLVADYGFVGNLWV
jgi:hypothetical protein